MSAPSGNPTSHRVVAPVPRSHHTELARLARRLRSRVPPSALARLVESVERRLKSVDAKLDEVLRRLERRSD
jgi:hypothetical protein